MNTLTAEKWEEILEWATKHTPTREELRSQAESFAYGNVHLSNPAVTREMISDAAKEIYGDDK